MNTYCLITGESGGIGTMGRFIKSDWARQQNLIDLNISALMHLSYLFGADMSERGNGCILNMASVAAFLAKDLNR